MPPQPQRMVVGSTGVRGKKIKEKTIKYRNQVSSVFVFSYLTQTGHHQTTPHL
jgi:hypothetical protein